MTSASVPHQGECRGVACHRFVELVFETISVIVSGSAVALAITGKKDGFLAGLFFLLLRTVLNALDVTLSTIFAIQMINASQFGFVLLALVSFIPGMRPATVITR